MRLLQRTVFYLLISYLRKRSTQKLEKCRNTRMCIILLLFACKVFFFFFNFKLIFFSFSSSHVWIESQTIKKAECQRIDAFGLWCCRRLLRVPWTARRSNQSILKEISPEHSLERLMLKLKLQYFGHLMRRANSFEKTPMLGKIEGGRRRR